MPSGRKELSGVLKVCGTGDDIVVDVSLLVVASCVDENKRLSRDELKGYLTEIETEAIESTMAEL